MCIDLQCEERPASCISASILSVPAIMSRTFLWRVDGNAWSVGLVADAQCEAATLVDACALGYVGVKTDEDYAVVYFDSRGEECAEVRVGIEGRACILDHGEGKIVQ